MAYSVNENYSIPLNGACTFVCDSLGDISTLPTITTRNKDFPAGVIRGSKAICTEDSSVWILGEGGWSYLGQYGEGGGGTTVTMLDNPEGGVDLTVDSESRTLAKYSEIGGVDNSAIYDRLTDLDGIIPAKWENGRYNYSDVAVPVKANNNYIIRSTGGIYMREGDTATSKDSHNVRVYLICAAEPVCEVKYNTVSNPTVTADHDGVYYLMATFLPNNSVTITDETKVELISKLEIKHPDSLKEQVGKNGGVFEKVADYTVETEENSILFDLAKPCQNLFVKIAYKNPTGQTATVTYAAYSNGSQVNYLGRTSNVNSNRFCIIFINNNYGLRDIRYAVSTSDSNVGVYALNNGERIKDFAKINQKPIDAINIYVTDGAVVGAGTKVEVWGC